MPTLDLNCGRLFYRLYASAGDAPRSPLLLVHGAGGNLMHWPGEMRRLSGQTVYALDLPGHGKSSGDGETDIGAYAEVVRAFHAALNLPQVVLIGHSMGGGIALEFALRYPQRLTGLILISTGARLPVAPEVKTGIQTDPARTADLLMAWAHGGRVDPKSLSLFRRRLREVNPTVFHGDFRACESFDRTSEIGGITAPTLVICGENDRMTPVKFSRELADLIPGAHLVIVPGAGHMVALEKPTVVAGEVVRFLAEMGEQA